MPALVPTQRLHYTPFDGQGNISPNLRVSSRAGRCWTSSLVDGRSDAWRCLTGNLIRDPCFESPTEANTAVCAEAPWSRRVVRVHSRLGQSSRFQARGLPSWALELVGGRRCVLVAGATDVLRGQRLNYFCGRHGPYLWGAPDRRHAVWRIRGSSSIRGAHMHRVKIRTAWR